MKKGKPFNLLVNASYFVDEGKHGNYRPVPENVEISMEEKDYRVFESRILQFGFKVTLGLVGDLVLAFVRLRHDDENDF